MKTKKAGCILLNLKNNTIGLVYRSKLDDYSFPKGHVEDNETYEECAIREVEEETGQLCHIIGKTPVLYYTTGTNEEVEVHFFFAIADGKSVKEIPIEDKEKLVWKPFNEVENTLSYQDLKDFWNENKQKAAMFFKRIKAFNDVKTPQELLEFMDKNINYGYVGVQTNKLYLFDDPEFNSAMFEKKDWKLSSLESLLLDGYGHCWNQVELEKQWFDNHNYEYKTIFIWFYFNKENNFPTHTYLIYKKNNKFYYFEHSDFNNRGIYEFNSYEEAIEFQKNKHIEYAKSYIKITNFDLEHLKIYEYESVPNCTAPKFIDNILKNAKCLDI